MVKIKLGPVKIDKKGVHVKGGSNPIDKAKDEVEDFVNDCLKDVRKELEKAGDEVVKGVESNVEQLTKDVKYEVATIGNNYRGAIEKVGEETLGKVGKEIEEFVEKKLEELAKALTKEGLKKFRKACIAVRDKLNELERRRPELHDAVNTVTIYLQLGPIKMEFNNFLTRAEQIITSTDIWIDHPPKFTRDNVKVVVNSLGPSTIDLGLSVNFALLIGSKELGVGLGIDKIQGALIEELLDALLEAIGVPKS